MRVDFYDPGLTTTTVNGTFSTFKVNAESDKYRSTFSGFDNNNFYFYFFYNNFNFFI